MSKKDATHERIVAVAGEAIRRAGFDGVSVADIMKDAGLTHGGFYAHFPSRDAMVAEALERAGADGLANLAARTEERADATGKSPLVALAEAYLSDRHVAAIESGCSIAALGSELPRQPAAVRKVATRRIKEMLGLVERAGAADPEAALATLVGALVLARAVDEPRLASALRAAAIEAVTTA